MTFGTDWGFGADEQASRSIFIRYIEAGGNFIDTADGYTGGTSEKLAGKFIREEASRDHIVLATKFTFNNDPGNPNGSGNGRKNIYRALEGSLQRLDTDWIDLYWLHAWDTVTPVEEVVATLSDLVREGKIRYYGFSDTPAWYLARAQTIAEKEGKERLIALQLEYSLVTRTIEREHIPAAQELGMGVCPWSPLAGGFLSGKYKPQGDSGSGEGRLEKMKASENRGFQRFTPRNWGVLEVLLDVSKQINKPPAQVALNWAATQPGITSTIIGTTKLSQLEDNLASIEFTIPPELRTRLNEASALEPAQPYVFFQGSLQTLITGGVSVRPWQPALLFDGNRKSTENVETTRAGS
jgi:aryl-alcohol dehydrogenase-like predicted oxidoreductase